MVSTSDSDSGNPGSIPGTTFHFFLSFLFFLSINHVGFGRSLLCMLLWILLFGFVRGRIVSGCVLDHFLLWFVLCVLDSLYMKYDLIVCGVDIRIW